MQRNAMAELRKREREKKTKKKKGARKKKKNKKKKNTTLNRFQGKRAMQRIQCCLRALVREIRGLATTARRHGTRGLTDGCGVIVVIVVVKCGPARRAAACGTARGCRRRSRGVKRPGMCREKNEKELKL